MKVFSKYTAALFACLTLFSVYASAHDNVFEPNEKMYIEPGTTYVSPTGLFVMIEGDLIPISALYSDSEGVYCNAFEVKAVWKCSGCKRTYMDSQGWCDNRDCPHYGR